MKRTLIPILCLTALIAVASQAQAQNVIYVDSQLSVASSTTYSVGSRSAQGGSERAYRTLADGAAAANPGTMILIRAGSYSDRLTAPRSGTADAPIIYRGYSGEDVFLTGRPGIQLTDKHYIVMENLRVENTTWLEAVDCSYLTVINCTFKHTPATGTTGNVRFIRSNHNKFIGNYLEDGQDSLGLYDANNNLVEGNTFVKADHSLITIRCSDFNMIRSNHFANADQKCAEVYDCGGDTSAVPNSFNSTSFNVFEGNHFAQTYSYYATSAGNGIQYSGQNGIIRNNIFTGSNVGIGMQHYGDEALYNNTNRVYHNVMYGNRGAGIATRPSILDAVFKNNILFRNQGCYSDCDDVSPGQLVYRTTIGQNVRLENNVILYETAGQPVIEREGNAGQSVAQYAAANPGVLLGTVEADPAFVDTTTFNFALRTGSAAIDKGTWLTKSRSSGSGSTLPVEDVSYFYDGFDIPGELGDQIQVQSNGAVARIVQIDRANRALQLDRPLTWSAGDGIALPYAGVAPDIGLLEKVNGNRPSAPQGLRILTQ